jgi:hypothetical protein
MSKTNTTKQRKEKNRLGPSGWAKSEADSKQIAYDEETNTLDIYDITGKTPFDELMSAEERAGLAAAEEHRDAQVEAVSKLLAYICSDIDPKQIAIRVFMIAYAVKPSLVFGMTLDKIGKAFVQLSEHTKKKLRGFGMTDADMSKLFGVSKQRLAQALKKQDDLLGYRGRNRHFCKRGNKGK